MDPADIVVALVATSLAILAGSFLYRRYSSPIVVVLDFGGNKKVYVGIRRTARGQSVVASTDLQVVGETLECQIDARTWTVTLDVIDEDGVHICR